MSRDDQSILDVERKRGIRLAMINIQSNKELVFSIHKLLADFGFSFLLQGYLAKWKVFGFNRLTIYR